MDNNKQFILKYLVDRCLMPSNHALDIINLTEESVTADGYVNRLYRVTDLQTNYSVIVKKILPYIRAYRETDGSIHEVRMGRMRTEIAVLSFMNTLYPGITPEIFHFNESDGIIVMEDLSHMDVLRFGLTDGYTYPQLGSKVGIFLAMLYFYTSDTLITHHCQSVSRRLFYNSEYHKMFGVLFGNNVIATSNRILEPEAYLLHQKLLKDSALQAIISALGERFRYHSDCLVHNDLHASNIMVNGKRVVIFDTEFSGYGPSGLDLGRFTSSMLINYLTLLFRRDLPESQRIALQAYDLSVIQDAFNGFQATIIRLWNENCAESYRLKRNNPEAAYEAIAKHALHYAALGLTCRIPTDNARSCDILRISNSHDLGLFQKRALQIASDMLRNDMFTNIETFIDWLRCYGDIARLNL